MKSLLADWLKVGHIKKAHGIRGELFLFLSAGTADWYSKSPLMVILLAPQYGKKELTIKPPFPLAELLKDFERMSHDQKLEFEKTFKAHPLLLGHIQSLKPHSDGFILQLKEITQRTSAEWLQGYQLYISKSLLKSTDDENPFLAQFLDTPVMVQQRQIGTITGFSSNGAQDILIVTAHSAGFPRVEYEIPLVESWIKEAKLGPSGYLVLELPEGLLEINQRQYRMSSKCDGD